MIHSELIFPTFINVNRKTIWLKSSSHAKWKCRTHRSTRTDPTERISSPIEWSRLNSSHGMDYLHFWKGNNNCKHFQEVKHWHTHTFSTGYGEPIHHWPSNLPRQNTFSSKKRKFCLVSCLHQKSQQRYPQSFVKTQIRSKIHKARNLFSYRKKNRSQHTLLVHGKERYLNWYFSSKISWVDLVSFANKTPLFQRKS